MSMIPPIDQQVSSSLPRPDGLTEGTNLIIPPVSIADRMGHFDEQVFDLRPSSHLVRLMSVILGDSGVGQFRKAWLLRRLASTLGGSHFFDLDRFYGALFGINRLASEVLSIDPNDSRATTDEWLQQALSDASYRSRLTAFSRAISYGATAVGMELLAEAILSVDCEVIESYVYADHPAATQGSLEAFTQGQLEAFTYGQLEGTTLPGATGQLQRNEFIIVPHRPLSLGEEWDLRRVLEVFKPANTVLRVEPQGVHLYDPVAVRGYSADSEYWEIQPFQDEVEVPRPPFSAYQGEKWSYILDVITILATAAHPGGITDINVFERINGYENTAMNYLPEYAMLTLPQITGSRAANSAVTFRDLNIGGSKQGWTNTNSNPLIGRTQEDPNDSLFIDRMPITQLTALGGIKQTGYSENRFWSTPARLGSDATQEIIEFRLGSPQAMNYLTFELPRFPHTVEVQAWSAETSSWVSVGVQAVSEAFPARLSNVVSPTSSVHPQHGMKGHWLLISLKINPITTDRWRFIAQRTNTGTPTGLDGITPIAYSLGMRSLDMGYVILSSADITASHGGAIASAPNIVGTRTEYRLHTEPASNLMGSGVWRSEPQPMIGAVVNLYVDTRLADGSPQVVDRWYLDPLYVGPLFHIYWSDAEPGARFAPTRDVLSPAAVSAHGNVLVGDDKTIFMDPAASAYVEVQNSALHFDPTLDWTFGVDFYPAVNQESANNIVADLGFLKIYMTPAGFQVTVGDAPPINLNVEYRRNQLVTLMVSRDNSADGDGLTIAWVKAVGDTVVVEQDWEPSVSAVTTMRLGSKSGIRGGYALSHAYLRTGIADGDTDFAAFVADPTGFVTDASLHVDMDSSTTNMVLRRAPRYVSEANPLGFVGGPGNYYEDLAWQPIERDFALHKGYIQVPPIAARYWKFEFSNLAPEIYNSFAPITRTVKLLPNQDREPDGVTREARQEGWPSLETHRDVAQRLLFADSTVGRAPSAPENATAMLYNPSTPRDALWDNGSAWRWQPWQIGSTKPRIAEAGEHRYEEVEVVHSDDLAFFVGLNALVPSRINYLTEDDASAYVDRFYDEANIADSVWSANPNDYYTTPLTSPTNGFEMTSKVLSSRRRVEAVQFASVQTHAIQLVPNDDFSDPASEMNPWTDVNDWHTLGDATLTWIGTERAVMLNRHPVAVATPPLDEDLPHHVIHPLETRGEPISVAGFGGISSGYVPIAPKGMVHAAVRFTAMVDTALPYSLEIVARDGTVVASKDFMAKAGETVEDWVSYQIASFPFTAPPSEYLRRSIITEPDHDVNFEGAPTVVSPPADPLPQDSQVQVRLVQRGGLINEQIKVGRLSLFEDAIVWEFSADGGASWNSVLERIRNNPDGVVRFTTPGTGLAWRATSYRPNVHLHSLQIRPWYEGKIVKRVPVPQRGANLSSFDHEPPIDVDPEFKQWFEPIPLGWFRSQQRLSMLPPELASTPTSASHFYARTIFDTLDTPSVTVSRVVDYQRVMWQELDEDGFIIPGDSIPTTESVTVSGDYLRSVSDSIPITESVTATLTPYVPSSIITEPDHEV